MEGFPKEFYCPITQELMTDPVIGPDGCTYDRKAIMAWLTKNKCSPMTRIPMNASQLVPNRALRDMIQEKVSSGKLPLNLPPPAAMPVVPAAPLKHSAVNLGFRMSAVSAEVNSAYLHLSIVPPDDGSRQPSAFICALDISESMDDSASLEHGSETTYFSRLDLVKHSMKTIIHMLSPNDYLALVPFNESANAQMNLTKMDEYGKAAANDTIDELSAKGQTNIWDALRLSSNIALSTSECNSLNTYVLLFTDGVPNINPPRGIVASLTNFLKGKNMNFSIYAFGYGYELDSELLFDIAEIGHGAYNYIPDSTMIGTIFVNFLSNALSTTLINAYIEIKTSQIKQMVGVGCNISSGRIDTHAIEYGQTRDFILKFEAVAYKSFSVTAKLCYAGKNVEKSISTFYCENTMEFNLALSRAYYCNMLSSAFKEQIAKKTGYSKLINIEDQLQKLPAKDHNNVKALLRDIISSKDSEGQVGKAFSNAKWFEKWGKHYVRSLISAHQLQQCNNFKDPGVQIYGGMYFKKVQDKVDEVFCSLPAPKPSLKHGGRHGYEPINMRSYMDYNAGCFDGEGLVKLSNGTTKKVKDLLKNDIILNSDGNTCKVVALVKISISNKIDLVNLNDVLITSWHPVRIQGEWKFPCEVNPAQSIRCSSIYNLVLDQHHVATINGLDVITLGHGFEDNKVVEHCYFGTQKVIDDLKKLEGWDNGYVIIKKWVSIRNKDTGFVEGFV